MLLRQACRSGSGVPQTGTPTEINGFICGMKNFCYCPFVVAETIEPVAAEDASYTLEKA